MEEQPLHREFPSFRNLRVFEAVAQHAHLGRAGIAVNMSQPAVTQAIKKVEHWVGTPLFERGWAGTAMTVEGRDFAARVRHLFDQVEVALLQELYGPGQEAAAHAVVARLKGAHVTILAAVTTSASFDAAAREIAPSRSAVQRTARELERLLGCHLYERTSGGLVANAAARRFGMALSKACRELSVAVDEIGAPARRTRERLFIGAQRLMCSSLLASAVNDVLARHPSVEVRVSEGSYRQLLHELRCGRIDLVFGALVGTPDGTDIVAEALFHEPYCVAGRHGHPLLARPVVELSDLARFGWVLPGTESQRSHAFENLFRRAELRPASCVRVTSLSTQVSILAESDRLTLLPRFELTLDPLFGRLAAIPSRVEFARSPNGLLRRADWVAHPVQSFFQERLRERVGALGLSL